MCVCVCVCMRDARLGEDAGGSGALCVGIRCNGCVGVCAFACGCVGVGLGVCACGCVGVGLGVCVCGCVGVGLGLWMWMCRGRVRFVYVDVCGLCVMRGSVKMLVDQVQWVCECMRMCMCMRGCVGVGLGVVCGCVCMRDARLGEDAGRSGIVGVMDV